MKFELSLSCNVDISDSLKLFWNKQCHKIFLQGLIHCLLLLLLFIVKSSLQCATEIIKLIDWLIDWSSICFKFGFLSSMKLCSWCRSILHYSLDSDVLWVLFPLLLDFPTTTCSAVFLTITKIPHREISSSVRLSLYVTYQVLTECSNSTSQAAIITVFSIREHSSSMDVSSSRKTWSTSKQ